MVAKFLDDNKSKRHCFKLHRSYLISFNLSNVGEIFWVFCVVLTYSIKRASEIRKFHVAVVQQRLRNVQKSVMRVQSCSFANLNLLLFCCYKESLLLWSRNFATIVTWRHTSPLCWHYNQNKLDTWGRAPLNGGI